MSAACAAWAVCHTAPWWPHCSASPASPSSAAVATRLSQRRRGSSRCTLPATFKITSPWHTCELPTDITSFLPPCTSTKLVSGTTSSSFRFFLFILQHPVFSIRHLRLGHLLLPLLHCAARRGLLHHQRRQAVLRRIPEHHVRPLPQLLGEGPREWEGERGLGELEWD